MADNPKKNIAKKIFQNLWNKIEPTESGGMMTLKETMQQLDHILSNVTKDLTKVHRGNKTAAQRVRVGTIKLERVAKLFRRESVAAEKGGRLRKPKVRLKKKKR